jgi:hypothetical protein
MFTGTGSKQEAPGKQEGTSLPFSMQHPPVAKPHRESVGNAELFAQP